MEIYLNENETIDDLQCKGLLIIQRKDGFCFGIDAVLLANFADVKKGDIVLDIGTGTGIISILLAGKTEAKTIYGLEIQKEMAEMAKKSVILNKLQDRIKIISGDIKNGLDIFGASKFDVIVTNPPYIPYGHGLINYSDTKAISRHEISCSLESIISMASKLLVPKGQIFMVHRPKRLVDVLVSMRKNSIEPKYIRFVHPFPYKKPNLFLIRGVKGGNVELKVMDPLYVYDAQGRYSDEIKKIYERT